MSGLGRKEKKEPSSPRYMLLAFFYLPHSLALSLLMGYGALILHLPLQVLPFRQTQTNSDAFIHRAHGQTLHRLSKLD